MRGRELPAGSDDMAPFGRIQRVGFPFQSRDKHIYIPMPVVEM